MGLGVLRCGLVESVMEADCFANTPFKVTRLRRDGANSARVRRFAAGDGMLAKGNMMLRLTAYLRRVCGAVALLVVLAGGGVIAAPVEGYKVVATYPHSTASYTEGFFYLDGMFYEGTGMVGRSAVMVVDPATGNVRQRHDLPAPYFGEGIVDWGPDIFEWTWQSHVCFVYDRFSMRVVKQFNYAGEGLGHDADADGVDHERRDGRGPVVRSSRSADYFQGDAPDRGEGRWQNDRSAERA